MEKQINGSKDVCNLFITFLFLFSDEGVVNETSAGYLYTRLRISKLHTLLPGNPFTPAFPFAP